ncbi:hypothetical protein [Bradyrhizobium sp. STM 3562]|uniref:hypothetical protein n=1 Tax=Bradyrhizobium sp. STM 3562 TaxID=578924 RepID=UPI00388D678B
MSVGRHTTVLALGMLALSAFVLAGCSSPIADMPSLGTPADASAHAKDSGTYLPVHDLPPDRDEAVIPPDQRAKIEAELIKARDRQASTTQNPNAK